MSVVGDLLQPTHLLFVLIVALVVLGPKRLPEVARTLGEGLRGFRTALSGAEDKNEPSARDWHEDENEPSAGDQPGPAEPVG